MRKTAATVLTVLWLSPADAQQDVEAIRDYVGCVILNAGSLAKGADQAEIVAQTAESMCKPELQAYIATQPTVSTDYRLALIKAAERQAIAAATLEVIRQRAK